MGYVTIAEKLEALLEEKPGEPISLPLEMLAGVCGSTSLAYFLDTAPQAAKDVLELYALDKVTGFYMELGVNDNDTLKKTFYVTFKDVSKKVHIRIDDTDFFDRDKIEKDRVFHMSNLIPGDLAVCIFPTYLLEDLSELLMSGFENVKWDVSLKEGTLFTVLSISLVGDIWFAKILYKQKKMWAFGAICKFEQFNTNMINDYHYI